MFGYHLERSNEEIDELLNQCMESEETGRSQYSGMTYEQGIQAAIRWLTEKDQSHPLDED